MNASVRVDTRAFCAYNKLFVEFEQRGKIWGTMLLDDNGIPIKCSENDEDIKLPKERIKIESI